MSLWKPESNSVGSSQLLAGKFAAITGGVTGIGRAIVLGYLAHGANVAVNHYGDSKSASQYQSLVDEAAETLKISKEEIQKRLVEVPGDVGNPETGKKLVKAVVDKWGRLDVVISNAGICEFKEFLECVTFPLQILTRALEPRLTSTESPPTSGTQPSPPTSQAHSTPSKPPPSKCRRNPRPAAASSE